MNRYVAIVVPLIAVALLTLACDDEKGTPAAPSVIPAETPTSGPTEAPTEQPLPTEPADTEEATPAGETPTIEPTTVTPAGPPIPMGTPAIAPADLSPYEGMAMDQGECFFDARVALANCMDRGLYAVDPPLTGEDISCSIFIVEGEPVVLLCRSQEPQEALYYAIKEAAP